MVSAVLLAASLDFATLTIAAALVEDEPVVPVRRTGILR